MKKSIILCLSILLIALTGCKKDKNSWGKLDEGAITINVGATQQLNFTHDGNKTPQWTSEDESIATVSQSGLVTGVRVGTTIISVNGLQCRVTVIDDYINVVEPMQYWSADHLMVAEYMNKNLGNADFIDLKWDTAYNTRIDTIIITDTIAKIDTIPVTDSTFVLDTTFVADTIMATDTFPYISEAIFTYEAAAGDASQFADEYAYYFSFDTENKFEHLTKCVVTVNANHTSHIKTYLDNRYIEVENNYYKAYNDWEEITHIYNKNPEIIFSSSKEDSDN